MKGGMLTVADQSSDGNTYQIGGSRFPLYDANLMFGAYGTGGTSSPAPYATPSVPPILGQTGQVSPMSNPAASSNSAALHPRLSPLPWVVGGLIGAVLLLHWLHWHDEKKDKKER